MNKVKIDCPLNFLDYKKLNMILNNSGFRFSEDPHCIIVDPGTDKVLGIEYFNKFPSLEVVGTPSTGVNHLDTEYLNEKGIKVFCLLDDRDCLENIHASAEFTWMHIMNSFRKFVLAVENCYNWREYDNETLLRSNELAGKKIGIIGLGRIGKKIAKYAKAFEMEILYYDPYVGNKEYKSVDSLSGLNDCDVISINCYLTPETKNMITAPVFDKFKKNLIVVNTSRGEVVDEEYISELVYTNQIVYSCDVLKNEQNLDKLRESPLFQLSSPKLTKTPHVAGATVESQYKALMGIISLCSTHFLEN